MGRSGGFIQVSRSPSDMPLMRWRQASNAPGCTTLGPAATPLR